jgi:tRNA pseudouridine55 synthase
VRFLTAADKEYEAGIRFGVSTDSYDIMGRELTRSGLAPSQEAVERALASLRGEYLQVPPAHSAKRIGGRRSYELARRDEEVTLAPVRVRVTRADLLTFADASARVAITCSSGFYVRSFAHALGEFTSTGACVESLRRTRHGEFSLSQAVTVDELRRGAAAVSDRPIPLDRLLPGLPSVHVSAEGRKRVSHGQELHGSHLLDQAVEAAESWVRLLDEQDHLLAVATASAARALHPAVVLI